MPKEDPARTGFTNSGYPSLRAYFCIACASYGFVTVTVSATGTPAAAAIRCESSLSIPTAELSIPHPMTGMPASSSTPCTVRLRRFFRAGSGRLHPVIQHGSRPFLAADAMDRLIRRYPYRCAGPFTVPSVLWYIIDISLIQIPLSALAADTDQDLFVTVGIHILDHRMCRLERHFIFCRTSAEQYGDLFLPLISSSVILISFIFFHSFFSSGCRPPHGKYPVILLCQGNDINAGLMIFNEIMMI